MDEVFAGCLAELERRSLLPSPYLAAFVVGSVARGWSNPMSDYDINVVSVDPWRWDGRQLRLPLDPPIIPVEVIHVDGRRWELKYWLDRQVDQMFAKVSWDRFEEGKVAGQLLVDTEEVFLERLVTCVPLAGEDWVDRRREEFVASAFRAYVVTRSLAESDDSAEDAIGQLAVSDNESAVLSARKAFDHAVDALLESTGVFGSHTPKWRARRFRDATPVAMSFEDYWAIQTMRDLDPDAPGPWVENVVRICKDLAMEAEV